MSWKCYEVQLRAKTPIHIGYKRFGIVNKTRFYIPGRNVWAVFTAILTKKLRNIPSNGDYQTIGENIAENMKFSYFYPCKDNKPLCPEIKSNGFYCGNMKEEKFEKEFISSFLSTAIDKDFGAALEKSLHEIEFIKPENIFLGYIFAKDGCKINKMDINKDELGNILNFIEFQKIGGERNYGFGAMELRKIEEFDGELYNKYNINKETLEIITKQGEEIIALSHVLINKGKVTSIHGDIEPLMGREWGSKGAGKNVKYNGIVLVPGAKFKTDYQITIDEFGLWKIKNLC